MKTTHVEIVETRTGEVKNTINFLCDVTKTEARKIVHRSLYYQRPELKIGKIYTKEGV